jgi:hypothetical protein
MPSHLTHCYYSETPLHARSKEFVSVGGIYNWYGWAMIDGEKINAHVAWVLENGDLVVNLWGAKRNYCSLTAADFITDPEAYWWCGHIGDEEETLEVKKGLHKVSPVGV